MSVVRDQTNSAFKKDYVYITLSLSNQKRNSKNKKEPEDYYDSYDSDEETPHLSHGEHKQNGNDSPWYLQTLVDDLHEKVLNGAGYVQTVTELTRWSKRVNSILDLHFTNRPDRTGSVKLTRNFRTDHAVMTLTRKQFDFPGPPAIYKRCWKQVDWDWVYYELLKWKKLL